MPFVAGEGRGGGGSKYDEKITEYSLKLIYCKIVKAREWMVAYVFLQVSGGFHQTVACYFKIVNCLWIMS